MCVRIVQYSTRMECVEALGMPFVFQEWQGGDTVGQYNVAPGSSVMIMDRLYEDKLRNDGIKWGYRSPKDAERQHHPEACVSIERAATGLYYRHMWKSGRVLMPIDGWYEWTTDGKERLPWYFHLKTNTPMFVAAVTNLRPYTQQTVERGCAIIADSSNGGLLDMGNRRPVVLAPEHARMWLEPWLTRDEAIYLASKHSRPPEDFDWHRVNTAVNKVTPSRDMTYMDAAALILPIPTNLLAPGC